MLNADVFISVPKLKAHHKVGATLNVKGLVGTVQSKNELPHWRIGFPSVGGDEFPEPVLLDKLLLFARHLLTDALPDRAYLGVKRRLRGYELAWGYSRPLTRSPNVLRRVAGTRAIFCGAFP